MRNHLAGTATWTFLRLWTNDKEAQVNLQLSYSVGPLNNRAPSQRLNLWWSHYNNVECRHFPIPIESLPLTPVIPDPFVPVWIASEQMLFAVEIGYVTDDDCNCQCEHLLVWPNLEDSCTLNDLETITPQTRLFVPHCMGVVLRLDKKADPASPYSAIDLSKRLR